MTPGFSRLSVTGYRRLSHLDIKLRPVNVLIGANGVGKSSFLDVIDPLAASAGGNLQSTVVDLGGMASLLTADATIPTGERLRRDVMLLPKQHDAVIALTDVYTGRRPCDFVDAADAKNKMRQWVGPEPRFHPHAAQYEVATWPLPYWPRIRHLAGSDRNPPSSDPETVNHDKPPAGQLEELFRTGRNKRTYSRTRDGADILRDQDLKVSAARCPRTAALPRHDPDPVRGGIVSE
jgi:energy-coupling factor transporter ATP-binding protein EcfA2